MLIREALPGDAAELARLRWDYRNASETGPVGPASGPEGEAFMAECELWVRKALSPQRWIIAVADSGDSSLVGCMYLQIVDKVPVPGAIHRAWGYITNSYVAPEARGQGTGEQLLALLIDIARSRDLEFLILWPSEEAVPFYQRAGFRPASEVHDRDDDYPPLELEL